MGVIPADERRRVSTGDRTFKEARTVGSGHAAYRAFDAGQVWVRSGLVGQWTYLYRAIDSDGDTVEFLFSENRDLLAAKRFLRKALERHGRPERIVIDGSQTNHEAIIFCDAENRLRNRSRCSLKPIRIRKSKILQ